MPSILSVTPGFPKNYYDQFDLITATTNYWEDKFKNLKRVRSLQENTLVEGRHLAMELERYFELKTFGERNTVFKKEAINLIEQTANIALSQYQIEPSEVGSLWSNTVTGFAIPSLDALLMNRIPFKTNTKRIPLLGLGCMAGIAGINRVADYLKGHPQEIALFFSVEFCTLTFQMDNFSVANILSTGLFGDGAAVVIMTGDNHPLSEHAPLKWLDGESAFFPETETVMGWDVSEKGLNVILEKGVPEVTSKMLPGALNGFLEKNHLHLSEVASYFAHPGGPKVLWALEKVLDLPQGGLKKSWESLKEKGNMSSVSVLDIFSRLLKDPQRPGPGELGLGLAMGPGFNAEMGLYQWQ